MDICKNIRDEAHGLGGTETMSSMTQDSPLSVTTLGQDHLRNFNSSSMVMDSIHMVETNATTDFGQGFISCTECCSEAGLYVLLLQRILLSKRVERKSPCLCVILCV